LCIARHHINVDANKAVLPEFKPDSALLGEPEDPAVQVTAPNWDHQDDSDAAEQAKKRAAEASTSKLVFNPTDKVCDDANPASGKTESAAEIVSDADCARQCGLRLTPLRATPILSLQRCRRRRKLRCVGYIRNVSWWLCLMVTQQRPLN